MELANISNSGAKIASRFGKEKIGGFRVKPVWLCSRKISLGEKTMITSLSVFYLMLISMDFILKDRRRDNGQNK